MSFTIEELVISRIAREMSGESIGIGATILSDIAMRVAKLLYAPDLMLIGGSYAAADSGVYPRTYNEEWSARGGAQLYMEWEDTFDIIRKGRFRIWMGPAQIDRSGSANMSVIGDWRKPKVQLVGARGLPDNLWGIPKFRFHMNRHTPRHFVEKVDFVCSLGYGRERTALNLTTGVPDTVISDLGVFNWDQNGDFKIVSLHPGVTFEILQKKTGFELKKPEAAIPTTPAPTASELDCIRNIVDPYGWRILASESASPDLLHEMQIAELKRTAPNSKPRPAAH